MSSHEIFEIRRENLNKVISLLISENGYKTGAELCKRHNLSASYISQLLNSHRQIGEKAAREIENKLGIPLRYLDEIDASNIGVEVSVWASLYEMKILQDELFKLEDKKKIKLKKCLNIEKHQYFIKVVGDKYFPTLHDGWYVLCDPIIDPVVLDYLYVKLVNQMCLILEFISEKDGSYNFQSLNGTRRISLRNEDIRSLHIILGIYSPNHLIAKA
jgi:transcriptional regulator with XRE-family HTH domain